MDRKANGTFAPGTSGNPGGRPAQLSQVIELARAKTTKMVETLTDIVLDTDQPTRDRVKAADIVLCRGWGQPVATLDTTIEDKRPHERVKVSSADVLANYRVPPEKPSDDAAGQQVGEPNGGESEIFYD